MASFFNKNEKKEIIGQEYKNAVGYSDAWAAVCCDRNSNLTYVLVDKKITIRLQTMYNSTDYRSLCEVLNISASDMIKLLATNKSKMQEILLFLNDTIKQLTLVCSLYIKTEEINNIPNTTESPNISRKILKISLGHHALICIPLKTNIFSMTQTGETVKKIIEGKAHGMPEFFNNDATALVDYCQQYQGKAVNLIYNIGNQLHAKMPKSPISLTVELPKTDKYNDLLNAPQHLSLIMRLKKILHFIKYQFFSGEIIPIVEADLATDLNFIADNLQLLAEALKYAEKMHFPPTMLVDLHIQCYSYQMSYFSIFTSTRQLPEIENFMSNILPDIVKCLEEIPYKRHENVWFIEVDDNNVKEILQKFLKNKWYVVVTNATKHLINSIFNDKMIWILSNEEKWRENSEPLCMFNGKDVFPLGIVHSKNIIGNAKEAGTVYLDCCNCERETLRAWICNKCKALLRELKNKDIKCECGILSKESIVKKCLNCQMIEEAANEFEMIEKSPSRANILFIGQSGAGKSMLVNSIYNYLTYDFETVTKAETVDCILPCQFQLQTPDLQKKVFKAGPEDANEHFNDNGESVTQQPKIYEFKTESFECKVVDTPGLGDTRGAKQDEHNLSLIRNAIVEVEELHAICFVMPSNIAKLTSNFEVHMRDLLSLFPKTVLKNVFFFFTYANSTFFTIGDTRQSLEEFIKAFKDTNNAEIPFGLDNVCCVDSEAFMYFIATKQGHKYQNRDLESFRMSWDKSKAAIETFLGRLQNIESVKSKDILMTYELEYVGTLLQKEKSPPLEPLIAIILNKISQISMTSKFNFTKNTKVVDMEELKKSKLFEALEFCKDNVANPDLKQLIIKLLEYYREGTPIKAVEQEKVTPIKPVEQQAVENGTKPPPPPRAGSSFECYNHLKTVAEKLAKEWQNGKISKSATDNFLIVQVAGNLKPKDIQKETLKNALALLLMEVKEDLLKEMTELHNAL